MESNEKAKKFNFHIISPRETKHRGFGAGAIDLSNVSSIIIDEGVAYVDMGAMHAKSKIERGIRFSPDPSTVPNGRKCWVVWVAVDRNEEGAYYAGVAACEMRIDAEARKGWKILADHVNRMDAAMKRKIMVDGLDAAEKAALKKCLVEHNADWWERSDEALKRALS
jgi:hypothetical protein